MGTALALIGLALLDSLSVGTLVFPLVLIVRKRRVDLPALGTYLGTVGAVYFALGVGLLLGINALAEFFSALAGTDAFSWITLALGVALAAFGILAPNPRKKDRSSSGTAEKADTTSGRGLVAMVALGLGASLTEAATMLPYIAAMGIISSTSLAFAAYCLVMMVPVLVVIVLAAAFGPRVFARVERAIPRLEYEAKVTLLWIAAIVGVYMAITSAAALELFSFSG
ncbi:GAP family protein [Corynebacterium camporealensis]